MAREYTKAEMESAREFARALRKARNEAGLNQTQLAERLKVARQSVTRYESGKYPPSRDFAIRVDACFQQEGFFESLLPSAESERTKSLRRYVRTEQSEAQALQQWQALVIPALLQTEEYAREVLTVSIPPRGQGEIDRFVRAQIERQEILWRERPIMGDFVLSEGAVTQLVGGPALMHRQWDKLIDWSRRNPAVNIQVLPRTVGAHASMQSSYTILEVTDRTVLYVESMTSGEMLFDVQTVDAARARFRSLMANALNPRETVAFIEKLMSEETP